MITLSCLFLFYNFINSYFIFSFVCFSCNKLFFSRKYLFAFPENSVGDKVARFERISGESLKWPEYKSFLCFLLKVLLMAFSKECIYKPSIQLNIYYGFREKNIVKLGAVKQQMKEIRVNMNIKGLKMMFFFIK